MDLLIILAVIAVFAYSFNQKKKTPKSKTAKKTESSDILITEVNYDVLFFDMELLKDDSDRITLQVTDKLTYLTRQGYTPKTDSKLTSDGLVVIVEYSR